MNEVTTEFESGSFEEGIRHVLEETSRTAPVVVNQAALNVAGRAMNLTKMTDKPAMVIALGGVFAVSIIKNKKGKFRTLSKWRSSGSGVPLAALLVQAQRARKGLPGLYGSAMRRAVDKMIGDRSRSVGFNRSGWLPTIRTLAAILPNPFIIAHISGISIIGQRKGYAIPATSKTASPQAVIENDVDTIGITGTAALQSALDDEGGAMQKHAEERFEQMSRGL